jgi:mannose/cellobiose epimerase-like protein (N-acyl-D-glucosamine 2-epimerase family)
MKLDPQPSDHVWYARLWRFAEARLIDHARGGWFPELAADDSLAMTQFKGKPDIYHSVQAALFPLVPGLSRMSTGLARLKR